MKRTPMPQRTVQLARSPFRGVPRVSPDPRNQQGRSQGVSGNTRGRVGKSPRKAASDAAMARVRPALKARADGRCEITGDPLPDGHGEAHHRLRRSGPDRDVLSNLVYLHPAVHRWVHSKVTMSRRFRWILRAWQNPADEPVFYRGEWARLDDEGNVTPSDPAPN